MISVITMSFSFIEHSKDGIFNKRIRLSYILLTLLRYICSEGGVSALFTETAAMLERFSGIFVSLSRLNVSRSGRCYLQFTVNILLSSNYINM